MYVDIIDDKLIGYLGDFGLSSIFEDPQTSNDELPNTTVSGERHLKIYQSKELMNGKAPSKKSDVYAFGVLMLQVITDELADGKFNNWLAKITCKDILYIINACLHDNAELRPKVTKIQSDLTSFLSVIQQENIKNNSAEPEYKISAINQESHHIGPYKILEMLGEGGMGKIYLVEQNKPVKKKMALKLIKLDLISDQVLSRFEMEYKALNLMDHVNVASVFGAGKNKLGQPYFLMEYVPGLTINNFCDQNKMNIRERIKLFLQVCDGILHAHQKGIVHRDIKPSNIMVKIKSDMKPTIKIIDFGVAKSLQQSLSDNTIYTKIGSFVGTQSYASPEQISGNASLIDTRTDIYSLGILLFELLSGIHPYDNEKDINISPVDLVNKLSSQQIPTPEARLKSLDNEAIKYITNSRSLTKKELLKKLTNELAWISNKCIEFQPENRYGSVSELKKDLIRYLNYLPVEAKKTNAFYKLKKFYDRNKLAVLLGITGLSSFLLMTIIALISLNKAAIATKEARFIAEFQYNQIKSIDPFIMGQDLKKILADGLVGEKFNHSIDEKEYGAFLNSLNTINFTEVALEQLEHQFFKPTFLAIKRNFYDNPVIQAKQLSSLSELMLKFGKVNLALQAQTESLNLLKNASATDQLNVFLAEAELGRIYATLGNHSLAEEYILSAKKGVSSLVLPKDPKATTVNIIFADSLFVKGQYKQAYDLYKETYELIQSSNDKKKQVEILRNLGKTSFFLGNNADAISYSDRALQLSLDYFGKISDLTLGILNNIAIIKQHTGNIDEAFKIYLDSQEISHKLLGENHPDSQMIMLNIITIYIDQKKFHLAITSGEALLEKVIEQFGDKHLRIQYLKSNIALAYFETGNYLKAEKYYRESYVQFKRIYNDNFEPMFENISGYLKTLKKLNKFDEANKLVNQIKNDIIKLYGEEDIRTITFMEKIQSI